VTDAFDFLHMVQLEIPSILPGVVGLKYSNSCGEFFLNFLMHFMKTLKKIGHGTIRKLVVSVFKPQ
jgi:hypothetical protein